MKVLCLSRRCKKAGEEIDRSDLDGYIAVILDGDRDETVVRNGIIFIYVKDMDVAEAVALAERRAALLSMASLLGSIRRALGQIEAVLSDEVKLATNRDVLNSLMDLGQPAQMRQTSLEELLQKTNLKRRQFS